VARRHRASLAAALVVVTAGGCTPAAQPVALLRPPPAEAYALQANDVLAIKFYRNPELNEDVTIRPDGYISLQLIDDVRAAGLTPAALSAELARRYDPELKDARVNVIVKTFANNRVFVSGEVGRQGVQDLGAGLTLYQAIQQAGGFLKSANRKQVVLIRRSGDGIEGGYAVDLREVESGQRPQDDVPLSARDIVVVPRSVIANVNLFVEQYVRNNLPVQNVGLGFPF
jgi:protein involved in polysaccharide export with SLBB domain